MSCVRVICFTLLACVTLPSLVHGEEPKAAPVAGCNVGADDFFKTEVWTKIGTQFCLTCHKAGGDAEDSKFLLVDPKKGQSPEEAIRQNREAFTNIAKVREKNSDQYRILLKASGTIKHGGDTVLKPDSTGYKILAEFVRRTNSPTSKPVATDPATLEQSAREFFEGVVMIEERRLLRRATLQLAGRLPTDAEWAAVAKDGLKAIPAILDGVMKEDGFYNRLREGFNDIFLTEGYGDGAESALSYEHFKTRHWTVYGEFPYKHKAKDEKELQQLRYKVSDDYRKALFGEPMKLIEHIVRNDRPFTEIVTADYIMVTPYTARGYGIFEELKSRFKNPDDPFEYIPVKLKALVGRNKQDDQESATGFYPHAGILSTFQYLRRYPTTETNRNRLRSRMYYQHFLGVDVLELAARVSDAAAVSAKYEVPTTQASECVVCHKTLDPVAGLFQDYYKFEGVYGRRKGGWYKDIFAAGFEDEEMPAKERWRSLQWLGERTAKDPRFAVAMVEHVYYILTGRKVLLPPKDLDDPLYNSKRRAYQAQRCEVESIAIRFSRNGFNLKNVFQDLIASKFYRADGVTTAALKPERRAELEDIGLVRMLSPEQVERNIKAIFGEPWNRLTDQLAMLYGGIDSREVTERAVDPSGAMGAIMRIMSNDVASKHTGRDFGRPKAERIFFREMEPSIVPGSSAEADAAIRKQIVFLHERILGRQDAANSEEVNRTYKLFAGIVKDAKAQKSFDPRENYFSRQTTPPPPPDPEYTIRAWRGVMTYLLRRQEFLYE